MIARLRRNGRTIDEIRDELAERGCKVSRSALGRHIAALDKEAAGVGGDLCKEIAGLKRELEDSRAMLVAEIRRVGSAMADRLAELSARRAILKEPRGHR